MNIFATKFSVFAVTRFCRKFAVKCSKTPTKVPIKSSCACPKPQPKKRCIAKSKCKPKHPLCGKEEGLGKKKPSKASLFRNVSLFGLIPAVLAFTVFTFATAEHPERSAFVPYAYLRLRTSPHNYMWGDGKRTLFHNPRVNPLPEGYEDELKLKVEDEV